MTLALTGIIVGASVYASDREKHNEILQQRQSNEILSLEAILKIVKTKIDGEIIEAEFEYEDGIPVYEFKYISKAGRVREMYVDAKTGKILKDKLD